MGPLRRAFTLMIYNQRDLDKQCAPRCAARSAAAVLKSQKTVFSYAFETARLPEHERSPRDVALAVSGTAPGEMNHRGFVRCGPGRCADDPEPRTRDARTDAWAVASGRKHCLRRIEREPAPTDRLPKPVDGIDGRSLVLFVQQDHLAPTLFQSGSDRRRTAQPATAAANLHLRIVARQVVGNLTGSVGGVVVDNQDVEAAGEIGQDVENFLDSRVECGFCVVNREYDRD